MYWLTQLAKNKFVVSLAIIFVFGLFLVPSVFAVSTTDTFGIDKLDQNLELGNEDIQTTVASLINVALSLLGVIAVVIILVGGFKWMTAGGNDEKTTEARKLIFAGIVGLAIILSAWAIARFVLDKLSDATNSGQRDAFDDTLVD